jgi:hypothetical protein
MRDSDPRRGSTLKGKALLVTGFKLPTINLPVRLTESEDSPAPAARGRARASYGGPQAASAEKPGRAGGEPLGPSEMLRL